jgi:hypothetical protein
MKRVLKLAVGMLAAAGMVACGGANKVETGSAKVMLTGLGSPAASSSVSQALNIACDGASCPGIDYRDSIRKITLVADCPGYDRTVKLLTFPWATENGLPVQLFDALPLASCNFSAEAFAADGTTLLFKGAMDFQVVKNTVGCAVIPMQQVIAAGTTNVVAPFISGIAVSDMAPSFGESIHLAAKIDNYLPTVSYKWSAKCMGKEWEIPGDAPYEWFGDSPRNVGFTFDNKSTTDFLSFCSTLGVFDGKVQFTFSVTDTNCAVAGSITSSVTFGLTYSPQGAVASFDYNTAPNILSINVSPDTEPMPGQKMFIKAVVVDPDGDMVNYSWSAACPSGVGDAERFSSLTIANPVFTVPMDVPPGSTCAFILKVNDGHGGENTGSFSFHTEPAPVAQ